MQRNLLLSHAVGVGDTCDADDPANYFAAEIIRAVLVLRINAFLKGHSGVTCVRFPGLPDDPQYAMNQKYLRGKGGSMVVFGIKGGLDAGRRFINHLKVARSL